MKEEIESNSPEDKEARLLNSAFKLFMENGLNNTSIQQIVDDAQVGKGTFYLYFKDKFEIHDLLVEIKAKQLFDDALYDMKQQDIDNILDQLIFMFDHIIESLKNNIELLRFIGKDLAKGVYSRTINKIYENDEDEYGLNEIFLQGVRNSRIKLENPDITLYMMIQLVSSSIYNSIIYSEPSQIDEYKEFLYDGIEKLLYN